jgi:hypothetical protein
MFPSLVCGSILQITLNRFGFNRFVSYDRFRTVAKTVAL